MLFNIRSVQMSFKLSAVKLKHMFKLGALNNRARNFVSVTQDEKKGTARVVLQKPPVNSLNLDMLLKLTSTIKDLEEKKCRGMIISSSCPKVFCAGFDVSELYKAPEENIRVFWKAFQTFWKTLYLAPIVTVAAVNGHAPAAGSIILLSCDHSVMVNTDCRLGLNETLLGFIAPKWVRALLINACGAREAEHALNMCKLFAPKEALELSIVDELVDSSSDLLPKAEEALDQFLKVPGLFFQKQKWNFRKPFIDDLISYESEDVDYFANNMLQAESQKKIGKLLESLKSKKK